MVNISEEGILKEIIKLANERKKFRLKKNFTKSGKLRNEIKHKGYLIEDTDKGYIIKKV